MDHNKTGQWNLENGYDPNININSKAYPYRVSGSVGDGDELSITLRLSKEHESCADAGFYIALHLPGEIPHRSQYKFFVLSFEAGQIRVEPKIITTSEGLRPYHPDRSVHLHVTYFFSKYSSLFTLGANAILMRTENYAS